MGELGSQLRPKKKLFTESPKAAAYILHMTLKYTVIDI